MKNSRPIAFILASTNHGTMLVNRNDSYSHYGADQGGIGVGHQILKKSACEPEEINFILTILDSRRTLYGDGVVALDCGANIGTHTIEYAQHMHGWGEVLAIEAQERVFYALAGNITINNCFNARAIWAALGSETGTLKIPSVDYFKSTSFGSLELKPPKGEGRQGEVIGQSINYSENLTEVRLMRIDELKFKRLDFIKIDIEGMEIEALKGAENTIEAFKPIMFIETLKSDKSELTEFLTAKGYKIHDYDNLNILAVHDSDKVTVTRQ